MSPLKNLFTASALLVLLNACGTAPTDSVRQENAAPRSENTVPSEAAPASGSAESGDMQSSYVRVDAANGQSVFACSYSINGKTVEGKSQEECERLKKDFEKAAGAVSVPVPPATPAPTAPAQGQTQVACAFNINGKLYEGKTQAECDKLKKDLGITLNVPSIPAPKPAPAPAPTPAPSQTSTDVACAFNINGKLYEGKSQAECDKLKKDLGLQF